MDNDTKRFLVYVPAFGTFYWTDCYEVAETIACAHWGTLCEISDSKATLARIAEHDCAKVNAARSCVARFADHAYDRHERIFACV